MRQGVFHCQRCARGPLETGRARARLKERGSVGDPAAAEETEGRCRGRVRQECHHPLPCQLPLRGLGPRRGSCGFGERPGLGLLCRRAMGNEVVECVLLRPLPGPAGRASGRGSASTAKLVLLGLGEVGPLPVRRFGNEALGLGERWPLEDGGAARVRLAEAVEEGVFCRLNCEELRTVRLSSSRPMSSKLPMSSIAEVSS